jgi:hypothetical protein
MLRRWLWRDNILSEEKAPLFCFTYEPPELQGFI